MTGGDTHFVLFSSPFNLNVLFNCLACLDHYICESHLVLRPGFFVLCFQI